MITSSISSPVVPLLERSAVFAERRHEALAGNIANIDTPGYKSRDLPVDDFKAAMAQAAQTMHAPPSGATNFSAGATSSPLDALQSERLYQARPAEQFDVTFQDGNNRQVERQAIELTRNAMMQRMAVELLAQQFQLLEAVISGRV